MEPDEVTPCRPYQFDHKINCRSNTYYWKVDFSIESCSCEHRLGADRPGFKSLLCHELAQRPWK